MSCTCFHVSRPLSLVDIMYHTIAQTFMVMPIMAVGGGRWAVRLLVRRIRRKAYAVQAGRRVDEMGVIDDKKRSILVLMD
eukprot:scaffold8647_cov179-Skeletonema_menzelii.AAC.1